LLFAPGDRPTVESLRAAIEAPSNDPALARVSFAPEAGEGWVELLASGLTFDLAGLAPATARRVRRCDHRFALPPDLDETTLEALLLVPGHHLSGAGAMLPVIRVMTGLAARLARTLPVRGVCWHPAGSCMAPAYFGQIVDAWLAGGAFPALGLTELEFGEGGALRSVGLEFFVGQELEVPVRPGEARADTVKLALRLADMLVAFGRVARSEILEGPHGESLRVEPVDSGRIVRLIRSES